jgi:hypothetical protein
LRGRCRQQLRGNNNNNNSTPLHFHDPRNSPRGVLITCLWPPSTPCAKIPPTTCKGKGDHQHQRGRSPAWEAWYRRILQNKHPLGIGWRWGRAWRIKRHEKKGREPKSPHARGQDGRSHDAWWRRRGAWRGGGGRAGAEVFGATVNRRSNVSRNAGSRPALGKPAKLLERCTPALPRQRASTPSQRPTGHRGHCRTRVDPQPFQAPLAALTDCAIIIPYSDKAEVGHAPAADAGANGELASQWQRLRARHCTTYLPAQQQPRQP